MLLVEPSLPDSARAQYGPVKFPKRKLQKIYGYYESSLQFSIPLEPKVVPVWTLFPKVRESSAPRSKSVAEREISHMLSVYLIQWQNFWLLINSPAPPS